MIDAAGGWIRFWIFTATAIGAVVTYGILLKDLIGFRYRPSKASSDNVAGAAEGEDRAD